MTKQTFKIAAIPADGIGNEVTAAGRRVLDTLAAQTEDRIAFDYQGVPHTLDPWRASDDRYDSMVYRRVGQSGLILPAISLGLWYNFGDNRPFDVQREVLRHAFNKGITHFDLANNYGPPYGSAEENFGRMMRTDFRPYRHELILSTKAGWDMWPGPQGQLGSRNYLLSSLDDSLSRLSIDYVDIFYSHRFDPVTPLEETVGALASAVRSGKARYVGISSYSAEHTAEAKAIADRAGISLVIHQPSYSLLNRWIESGLTEELRSAGMGAIAFTALAQGLLTDRYATQNAAKIDRATTRPTLPTSHGHRRGSRKDSWAESHCRRARAISRADGARMGTARPGRSIHTGRRVERSSARRKPRRTEEP